MSDQPPILVLTGTTASGKNSVGVRVAQQLDGEIVSLGLRSLEVLPGSLEVVA